MTSVLLTAWLCFVEFVSSVAVNQTEVDILNSVYRRLADYSSNRIRPDLYSCPLNEEFLRCDADGFVTHYSFRGTFVAVLTQFNATIAFGFARLTSVGIDDVLNGTLIPVCRWFCC
jgi:hypothetical protein